MKVSPNDLLKFDMSPLHNPTAKKPTQICNSALNCIMHLIYKQNISEISLYLIKRDCAQHFSGPQAYVLFRGTGLIHTVVLGQRVVGLSYHDHRHQAKDGVDCPKHEEHERDPLQHLWVCVISVTGS